MYDEEQGPQKVKKISISLSNDVLDWVLQEKGDLKVSTFINQVLRNAMKHGGEYDLREEYAIRESLAMLENRLKRLEDDIHDLRAVRSLNAGKLGRSAHVSILSTRPKDVFGELVSIKNVSAKNAAAVSEELTHFLQSREAIDRQTVLKELFPLTRSTITNDINYWYNACRGVLDHLIEEGFVVRLGKNKYRWIGDTRQD